MSRYHVHVYKIEALAEINLDAETPGEAMTRALEMTHDGKAEFGPADTDYLAIPLGFEGMSPFSIGMARREEEE